MYALRSVHFKENCPKLRGPALHCYNLEYQCLRLIPTQSLRHDECLKNRRLLIIDAILSILSSLGSQPCALSLFETRKTTVDEIDDMQKNRQSISRWVLLASLSVISVTFCSMLLILLPPRYSTRAYVLHSILQMEKQK